MFFWKRNNQDVFMEVAYPHLDFVYNMARKLSGNSFDAEDLVQETFTIAFRKVHQLKDHDKARPWLLAILRNLYLRSREKNRPELLDVPDEESYVAVLEKLVSSDSPESNVLQKHESREFQRALKELPEKYKTPLILFYSEEWSYRQISEALDLPLGTIMSRLSRGRDLLKKALLADVGPRKQGKVIAADFAPSSGQKTR